MEKTIYISGMACGRSANALAATLMQLNGVYHAAINFAGKTATVQFTNEVSEKMLVQAVQDAGYTVTGVT